jgi:hypothetical protein
LKSLNGFGDAKIEENRENVKNISTAVSLAHNDEYTNATLKVKFGHALIEPVFDYFNPPPQGEVEDMSPEFNFFE